MFFERSNRPWHTRGLSLFLILFTTSRCQPSAGDGSLFARVRVTMALWKPSILHVSHEQHTRSSTTPHNPNFPNAEKCFRNSRVTWWSWHSGKLLFREQRASSVRGQERESYTATLGMLTLWMNGAKDKFSVHKFELRASQNRIFLIPVQISTHWSAIAWD